MSGPLDDLDFSITIDLGDAPEKLRQVNASVQQLGVVSQTVMPSTRALAQTVKAIDFSSTTAGADSLYRVASAAGQTADVMDTVSTALDVVETSVTGLAVSTEYAAAVSSTLGRTLHTVAAGAKVSSSAFTGAGTALRTVSSSAMHVAHTMHAAVIVGDLLASAFAMLMVPIRAVWSVGVAAFNALSFVMSTVLFPVRMLWNGLTMVAGAAFKMLGPMLSVALAVGKAWFAFRGFVGAIKVIGGWLSFLPPRLRILAGGLLALGLSGKVGAAGLRVLSGAAAIAAGAARVAVTSVRALLLPIQAITNPAKAARNALSLLATAATMAGSAALSATGKVYGLAAGVAKLAASPLRSAVDGFRSLGSTVLKLGPQIAAVGAMAAVAWGTKVAVATEKNVAVFGTMLKDMGQGAAVVKSLQNTKAAKLFDNQELLDSGRLLYKAGVSAKDVAGKTNQLATIAAATSTELGDLARIYQQGANTGSFGLDKINQLAERGIDIYHALEAATGQSGEALKKMISEGKIGTAEMDAALAHLTEGHGIYAGSLDTMANTTAGKMATIKNQVGQALGQVMGIALSILAPFGTAMVTLSEGLSETFTSFRGPIIYGATAVAWFFGNLVNIAKFSWASVKLFAVTAFNDMAYFFTTKIPAYLTWFGDNWRQIFFDAGNLVVTVFSNVATNIKNAMRAIWDYIKSGGTSELKFAFTPLLDGFKATVSQMPDIPDRAMTELEKSLTAQTQDIGTTLADNFDKMLAENQQKITEATPEIKDTASSAVQAGGGADSAAKAAKKAAENSAIGVRSQEGQNLVAQFAKVRESDTQKAAAKATINTEKHLGKLVKDVERSKPIVGKAWAA